MRAIFYILLFMCFWATDSYSQNFKEDWMQMEKTYKKMKNISLKMRYNYYASYTSKEMLESEEAIYIQKESNKYFKLLEAETILLKNYTIYVDNNEKLITINEPRKNIGLDEILESIEQMMKVCSEIRCTNNEKDNRTYQLVINKKSSFPYHMLQFTFNPNTFHLQKVVLFYNESVESVKNSIQQPRVEIIYEMSHNSKIKDDTIFKTEKYFTEKSGKYISSPLFKNYQVIYQKN